MRHCKGLATWLCWTSFRRPTQPRRLARQSGSLVRPTAEDFVSCNPATPLIRVGRSGPGPTSEARGIRLSTLCSTGNIAEASNDVADIVRDRAALPSTPVVQYLTVVQQHPKYLATAFSLLKHAVSSFCSII